MTTGTKYTYVRDPKNPQRVVTVSRHLDGEFVKFGYSVCRPLRRAQSAGDFHKKKIGRTIAEGRMVKDPTSLPLKDGEHPMRTIGLYLSENAKETSVRRIFQHWLTLEPKGK